MHLVVLCTIIYFISINLFGQTVIGNRDAEPIVVENFESGAYLNKHVTYIKGEYTLPEVLIKSKNNEFKLPTSSIVRLGTSTSTHWFKVSLRTKSKDQPKTIILDTTSNSYEDLEIYSKDGLIKSLDTQTIYKKRIRLEIKPKETLTLFVKFRTDYMMGFAFRIWHSEIDWLKSVSDFKFFCGIILTSIMMTILFTAILYYTYRRISDLVYIAYLVTLGVWLQSLWGIFEIPWVSTDGGSSLFSFMVCFTLLFCRFFLKLDHINKTLAQYTSYLAASCFAISLFGVFSKYYAHILVTRIYPICFLSIIGIGTYVAVRTRQRHTYLFLGSWSVLVFGGIISGAILRGDIKIDVYPVLFQSSIITLENIIMIFAIGEKIRATEVSKEHSYRQLRKVFYPHQLSQMMSGQELESTMITSPGSGVVICFDIVGSSKLRHPKLKEFIEESIHDCMQILSENYSKEKMTANGYRIKEMGDGFLCSIGYPFKSPEGRSEADLAVELSRRFINHLELNVRKFELNQSIFCGIGIAQGKLHGYYPKSGTKEYDLFGRGIVLATRYEAMRKKIFPQSNSHTLILQSEVYNSLSSLNKNYFKKFELSGDIGVRDDNLANHLFYELVPFGAIDISKSA